MELEPQTKKLCKHCGRELDEDNIYNGLDGEPLCEECFYDDYFYCERCGGVESLDDSYAVHTSSRDTEHWCDECRRDYAFRCDCCDELYSEGEVDCYSTASGGLVCEYCRDDYYSCSNCGGLVHCDDAYYIDDDDDAYCYECYQRASRNHFRSVMGYHSRPPMEYFYGQDEQPTQPFKGFGIELEVDEGNIARNEMAKDLHDIVGNHLYYNTDGSLGRNGFEIISMPHTEKALYDLDWETVLHKLVNNGFTSHNNGNCGLHMHVSRAFFGDTEQERTDNIAKMIMFYELFWEDIRRFSRRTNSQVRDWANRYCGDETPTEARCKDIATNRYGARYRAVNLNNSNTIEFRIMRGSLRYQTFMATLDFLITTAKNCKNIDWTNINDKDRWLSGIKDDTIEYMKLRRCFGYTNNQDQDTNDEVEDDGLH